MSITSAIATDGNAAVAWDRQLEQFERSASLRMGPKQARATAAIARRFCWHASRAIRRLDAACVEAYLADLAGGGSGRKLKTLHNHRWAVAAFCRHLVNAGILAANPASPAPQGV